MARLYANENFPRAAVEALRVLGHDVLTTHEAGQANQGIPDDQVLTYATAQRRAVVTLNRQDFIRLHRRCPEHGGIVVCTVDPDHEGLAKRIHIRLKDPLEGKLLRVNRE